MKKNEKSEVEGSQADSAFQVTVGEGQPRTVHAKDAYEALELVARGMGGEGLVQAVQEFSAWNGEVLLAEVPDWLDPESHFFVAFKAEKTS